MRGPNATVGYRMVLSRTERRRPTPRMLGTPGLNASLRLSMAIASDNYSELPGQFGVPANYLSHAFSADYMASMKEWREAHGLSTAVPDFW